jgi:hypothetical protein
VIRDGAVLQIAAFPPAHEPHDGAARIVATLRGLGYENTSSAQCCRVFVFDVVRPGYRERYRESHARRNFPVSV